MNLKHFILFFLLLCCLFFFSGCMAEMANPLVKAEATPLPGVNMQLHAASASETNVAAIQVSLYYRFLDQPMLACETRSLVVSQDESIELAIAKALLQGPSAGHSDLQKLFPDSVTVESAIVRNHTLFITFNEALLIDNSVPTDWANLPEWVAEAPLKRKLMIQSLVASITENSSCSEVQVLVNHSQNQSSLRLENAYFLENGEGLSQPQTRNESLLLTPENTASLLLEAWRYGDFETLYAFLMPSSRSESKPSYQALIPEIDQLLPLSAFHLHGGGSVSADGQSVVLTVDLALLREGMPVSVMGYPLTLTRENNIWKLRYAELQRLLSW